MGHLHFLLDKMGSDKMGLDKMGSDKMGLDKMGLDEMGLDEMALNPAQACEKSEKLNFVTGFFCRNL